MFRLLRRPAAIAALILLAFGGLTAQAQFLNDTWRFNGKVWKQAIASGCSTACPNSPRRASAWAWPSMRP